MIFLTTGSTKLSSSMLTILKELDKLKKNKLITEKVIAQIGEIEYQPNHLDEYFPFTQNIDEYFNTADLIITADGAGTIFELLSLSKKVIVFVNPDAQKYGANAKDFIGTLEAKNYLVWCKKASDLYSSIQYIKSSKLMKYSKEKNEISSTIINKYNNWLRM